MKHVRQDVEINVGSVHFVAPEIEFDQCPNCGEQIFDLAAMEKIETSRQTATPVKARRRKIV
jgi:YgiT-type zinc finger domain-containing protein